MYGYPVLNLGFVIGMIFSVNLIMSFIVMSIADRYDFNCATAFFLCFFLGPIVSLLFVLTSPRLEDIEHRRECLKLYKQMISILEHIDSQIGNKKDSIKTKDVNDMLKEMKE